MVSICLVSAELLYCRYSTLNQGATKVDVLFSTFGQPLYDGVHIGANTVRSLPLCGTSWPENVLTRWLGQELQR